jgi:hypothetical protein
MEMPGTLRASLDSGESHCWPSSAACARGHAATKTWLNSKTAVRNSLLGVERGAKMQRAGRTSPKCRPPIQPTPPQRTGANQGLSPANRASQEKNCMTHPLVLLRCGPPPEPRCSCDTLLLPACQGLLLQVRRGFLQLGFENNVNLAGYVSRLSSRHARRQPGCLFSNLDLWLAQCMLQQRWWTGL